MASQLIYNGIEFADDGSGILAPAVRVTDAITDLDQLTTKDYVDSAIAAGILPSIAANTLIANATGSTAAPTAVGLGTGLAFAGGLLTVSGVIKQVVPRVLTGSGTYVPTAGLLYDGYSALYKPDWNNMLIYYILAMFIYIEVIRFQK